MTISGSKRKLVLALTLFAVVGAALHASDPSDKRLAPQPSAVKLAERPARAAVHAETLPAFDSARLKRLGERRPEAQVTYDPFPVEEPETRPVERKPQMQPARPVAAPQAPAVPFRFLGAQDADGVQLIFLEQGNRTHIARVGEHITADWRIDRFTEGAVIFTYLPLGQQSALPTGGPG